ACGWAAFPLLHRVLARLPDRGYAASRAFGLLGASWIAFLFVGATGVPLGGASALGAIALLGMICVGARRAIGPRDGDASGDDAEGLAAFVRRNGRVILFTESLFAAGLLLFAWIERRNPAVDPDSERFMDYAFLNATLRSPGLPVADPWFSGQPIDYYHFGYAIAAFLVRATGVSAARLLTVEIAIMYALVWACAFGLGLALTDRCRGGAAAAFLVLGAGNLEWVRQWRQHGGLTGFDWFLSSRVIDGAISEFPWFSLLWGDLHPYAVALPLFLCGLTFVAAESLGAGSDPGRARLARATGFALVAGGALATHAWDFPLLVLVACASILCGAGRRRGSRALCALVSAGVGAALFGPFLRGFQQSGRSLAIVTAGSRPANLAMAFGPFVLLALLVPVALLAGRKSPEGGAGQRPAAGAGRVAAALAGCALLAIAACEWVYLKDFFSATALFRMNTVFKVHRIAWLLLAIASPALLERLAQPPDGSASGAAGARWPSETLRRFVRLGMQGAVMGVFAAASVYPLAGTASWLRARQISRQRAEAAASAAESPGADAGALFRALYPGDAAAAACVAARARPGDVILEESGEAYSWSSRISTFSGVPTVLGWGNHEAGWRDDWGPILERSAAIETIYRDPLGDRARSLMRSLGVTWVVVGERERRHYGLEGPARFSRIGRTILDEQGTLLYAVGDRGR
ncbi:MAG TPA: DUF2298 domain-containing protein, partial [Candidatus Polarisedimenticolia bacterium]|nr:DUF2298 domain-containing protein [Candidatus Polarisedimenticolia bacterium]